MTTRRDDPQHRAALSAGPPAVVDGPTTGDPRHGDPNPRSSPAGAIAAIVFGLVLLLFLPLAIAAAEHFLLHTHHFEDGLRAIGLHDKLGMIYKPIFELFQ
ncbi:MAG TPA: hypothetical protein VGE52_05355 [Pirellulales bacterium]